MKITDYPAITSFTEDNILLVDGEGGTKKIAVGDAILAALHMTSVENHRRIFRGKNLGTAVSSAQRAAIQAGTFEDLWLGDYWEINGIIWRIADFDYWLNTGGTESADLFTKHHLVIVPDAYLYTSAMNSVSDTSAGYVGSDMYKTGLVSAKTAITSAFGSSLLTHKEYLINAASGDYPSAGSWYASSVELMNEPMVFGGYMSTAVGPNVKRHTISKTQLALFNAAPRFINMGYSYWLRDVASSLAFAAVSSYGGAHVINCPNALGVRPVFPIG